MADFIIEAQIKVGLIEIHIEGGGLADVPPREAVVIPGGLLLAGRVTLQLPLRPEEMTQLLAARAGIGPPQFVDRRVDGYHILAAYDCEANGECRILLGVAHGAHKFSVSINLPRRRLRDKD